MSNQPVRILIRADASWDTGAGHIIRCLTLATELKKLDYSVSFLSRKAPGDQHDRILDEGFPVIEFDTEAPLLTQLNFDRLQIPIHERSKKLFNWIIFDTYLEGKKEETAFLEIAENILVIDDLADREHFCNVLVDQNPSREHQAKYDALTPVNAKKLLGSKFAIVSGISGTHSIERANDENIFEKQKIVTYFGNGYSSRWLLKFIPCLLNLPVQIEIMIEAGNPNLEILSTQLSHERVKFHRDANHIVLLRDATLAFGAGGAALWQRLFCGVPAVVISIADNQRSVCQALSDMGAIVYLGHSDDVEPQQACRTISDLLGEPQRRRSLSERGIRICDGRAAERIAKQVYWYDLVIREAKWQDSQILLDWRNDPRALVMWESQATIGNKEHATWYRSALKNKDIKIFLAEFKGVPVGMIRFNIKSNRARVSIGIDPERQGRGLGSTILRMGIERLKSIRPEISLIEAKVMSHNDRSLKMFQSHGFKEQDNLFVLKLDSD